MDLYQKVILDHYKNPRNQGELPEGCISEVRDNPVCGDQVKVMLRLDDQNRVGEIKFTARGCALSIASASMMTELILHKPGEEAPSMVQNIIDLLLIFLITQVYIDQLKYILHQKITLKI